MLDRETKAMIAFWGLVIVVFYAVMAIAFSLIPGVNTPWLLVSPVIFLVGGLYGGWYDYPSEWFSPFRVLVLIIGSLGVISMVAFPGIRELIPEFLGPMIYNAFYVGVFPLGCSLVLDRVFD